MEDMHDDFLDQFFPKNDFTVERRRFAMDPGYQGWKQRFDADTEDVNNQTMLESPPMNNNQEDRLDSL